MFGKLEPSINEFARKHLRQFGLVLLGTAVAVAVLGPVIVMMELTLKRIDHQNQEQITWRCNGNGGLDDCTPYARA